MRSAVIVTVKDRKGNFTYDVEVPVTITAQKAAADIAEVLSCYKAGIPILAKGKYHLKNERTGSILSPEKTLYESGVWQGDVLLIME